MVSSHTRSQQTYDHRLRDLVRTVGDPEIVAEFGVPRSTALGWLRGNYGPVVTANILDMDHTRLQAEVLTLRGRIRILGAIVRLLLALLRALDVRRDRTRLPEGAAKRRLLWAIERTQGALSLRGALNVLRLWPSRYHQWRRAEQVCELDDGVSCPRSTPTRLTAAEILDIKEMVESPEYRQFRPAGSQSSPSDSVAYSPRRQPGTGWLASGAGGDPAHGSTRQSPRMECELRSPMRSGTSI